MNKTSRIPPRAVGALAGAAIGICAILLVTACKAPEPCNPPFAEGEAVYTVDQPDTPMRVVDAGRACRTGFTQVSWWDSNKQLQQAWAFNNTLRRRPVSKLVTPGLHPAAKTGVPGHE